MLCRFRMLLRCPSCDRVFCVAELAGSSVVYHRECGSPMARVPDFGVDEHADRVDVRYAGEREQLEVSTGAQG